MPTVLIDNPRTRAGWTCPLCLGSKDAGLVTCWSCFKISGYRDGDPRDEKLVSDFEAFLESQELLGLNHS